VCWFPCLVDCRVNFFGIARFVEKRPRFPR
jgi:hypothetical protein